MGCSFVVGPVSLTPSSRDQTPRGFVEDVTTRTVHLRGGTSMPLIGLGTWQLRGQEGYAAVRAALDAGYRHIDTATMYRNEDAVGRAVRDSGLPREDVFVTTKLPPDRVDRPRQVIEESLQAMGLDFVDLWLIHWPPGGASPKTWEALIAARDDGLAKAIGVSNYSTSHVDELIAATGETPAVNQVEWSPVLHDAGRAAELRDRGVVLEGYSPFKSSNLQDGVLTSIADSHGVAVPQVIVRWHVQHEFVVIPKSARPERIAANADVARFALTEEEMDRIDALGRPEQG
jgi:2,5-diketo-D-gluconate reductase A